MKVHVRVDYYPKGSTKKAFFRFKTDSSHWDRQGFGRTSFVHGQLQVAGGIGARLIGYRETKRTKT